MWMSYDTYGTGVVCLQLWPQGLFGHHSFHHHSHLKKLRNLEVKCPWAELGSLMKWQHLMYSLPLRIHPILLASVYIRTVCFHLLNLMKHISNLRFSNSWSVVWTSVVLGLEREKLVPQAFVHRNQKCGYVCFVFTYMQLQRMHCDYLGMYLDNCVCSLFAGGYVVNA